MPYRALTALCAVLIPASANAQYAAASISNAPATKEQKQAAANVIAQCVSEAKVLKAERSLSRADQIARSDKRYVRCFMTRSRQDRRLVEFIPLKI
jgi:hypothetical protein